MAVVLKDPHLERLIEEEAGRRGHATSSRTLGQLLTERLAQLEVERRDQPGDAAEREPSDRDAQPAA